ncbi:MAG TPA: PEP-CTERM sorting domain-containing protein [Candidatus Paceibacterota bacterium]|nr:PEP-CTERM sorting domain-containing protein [Verrucomicrobiota bacterium]HSA11435.1 PEP-CTERM sorting domain-containing protein [Candidatus Paceibacterota bacterium]
MRTKVVLVTAALVSSFACESLAFYVNVLEARATGGAQNTPNFTMNGPAVSTAKSTAAPLAGWTGGVLSGTGTYYAGDTTPIKWGDWSFTPGTGYGGYYDVYATWVNVTVAQNMPPIWTVNNAGAAVVVSPAQTSGGNAWNLLGAGLKFNQGTAYSTRLATPGTGTGGKRASFDSVAWAASAPAAVTYNAILPDDATDIALTGAGNDLSWTAGSYNSFFDVWFGTTSGSLTKVATLAEGTTSWDPESLAPLSLGTQYFWRIDAGNVDRLAGGTEYNFTTLVPEPSSALLGLLGGLGLMWIARRRTA